MRRGERAVSGRLPGLQRQPVRTEEIPPHLLKKAARVYGKSPEEDEPKREASASGMGKANT